MKIFVNYKSNMHHLAQLKILLHHAKYLFENINL